MNKAVISFLTKSLIGEDIPKYIVLEVGAADVNGSPREAVLPLAPKSYVGVDVVKRRGVDIVMDVCSLKFEDETFDLVIATELIEHVQDWKKAVTEMKRVLRVGGLLLASTRSKGFPFHPHPIDAWRFELDDFRRIFSDFEILVLESDPTPNQPGVFIKARRRDKTLVNLDAIQVSGVSERSFSRRTEK